MTLQVWNLRVIVLKIHLSWHYAAYSCCLSSFPAPLSYIINSSASHYIGIKKTSQSLFLCCLELYSHSSLVEAQTALCPAGFKEAEMAADVGTLQSHVCPRPRIVVPLTFHLGTLSLTHVMTSDRF